MHQLKLRAMKFQNCLAYIDKLGTGGCRVSSSFIQIKYQPVERDKMLKKNALFNQNLKQTARQKGLYFQNFPFNVELISSTGNCALSACATMNYILMKSQQHKNLILTKSLLDYTRGYYYINELLFHYQTEENNKP